MSDVIILKEVPAKIGHKFENDGTYGAVCKCYIIIIMISIEIF